MDLFEIAEAVGLAALVRQQRVALAGLEVRRDGAEPGSEIALQFRIERVLQPHIGAVRMRRIGMHHRGVGQPVAPSSGTTDSIGLFCDFRRLTWKGQVDEAATPSLEKSSICTIASCQ